jgi:hypothetical protein
MAGREEIDPDTRIIKMLGARGSHMAAESALRSDSLGVTAS